MIRLAFFRLYEYIKFYAASKSTKGHGIHSPFVYAMARHLRNRFSREKKQIIKKYRSEVLNNNKLINYRRFGAGSSRVKTENVKISKLARAFSLSYKECLLLNNLIGYLNPSKVIEFGTSLGVSTTAILSGHKCSVTTLEGNQPSSDYAKKKLEASFGHRVTCVCASFDDILNSNNLPTDDNTIVFIDGNHTYEATIRYTRYFIEKQVKAIIVSDIYWNKEMLAAWKKIISIHKIPLTIDFYHFGLIVLNVHKKKQHFCIRY